jgi:hypothetical protein
LQFRHSDNINYILNAMKDAGLPDVRGKKWRLEQYHERKDVNRRTYPPLFYL